MLPGAPERITFPEHCFLHNNNKVAEASHANRRSSNTTANTAAAAALLTLPLPPLPPLCQPLSIRRRQTPPLTCSIAAAAAHGRVMEGAALLSAGEKSDKALIDDFEQCRWVKVREQRRQEEEDDEYQSRMDWGMPEDVIAIHFHAIKPTPFREREVIDSEDHENILLLASHALLQHGNGAVSTLRRSPPRPLPPSHVSVVRSSAGEGGEMMMTMMMI